MQPYATKGYDGANAIADLQKISARPIAITNQQTILSNEA